MRYPVLVVPFLNVSGMALFPFILVKKEADRYDAVLIRHETIHLRQAAELLIVPFYLFYLLNYLVNLVIYKNHHKAYFNIVFEKEAYRHELDSQYLKIRRFWGWRFHFR